MKIYFTIYPFVAEEGEIEIPDGTPREQWEQYVNDHFESLTLTEVSHDYAGADIAFEDEEECA